MVKKQQSISSENSYKPFKTVNQFVNQFGLKDRLWRLNRSYNKLKFPRLSLKANAESELIFNNLIEVLDKHNCKRHGLERTKSGGIKVFSNVGYDVDVTNNEAELIFMDFIGEHIYGFRVSFGIMGTVNEEGITGRGSYFKMKEEFKKDGIDLNDYAIDNGEDVKKEIVAPLIEKGQFGEFDQVYEHVNHIDLHSAYPSGLCNSYPEFTKTCARIYNNRKASENGKRLKLQMDAAMGYFQSSYCVINHEHYALAQLAKAGVNWCRKTIEQLSDELEKQGKIILLYNTDGIWYIDRQNNFKAKLIGDGIGKASIDHKNCTFRMKSKGCYEYIEKNHYTAVARGVPKSKSINWKWGDIYSEESKVVLFRFNKETFRIEHKDINS